jgi:SAM-dependent methyltransferase
MMLADTGDSGNVSPRHVVVRLGRRGLRILPPTIQRRVRTRRHRHATRAVPLQELDAELTVARELFTRSDDQARAHLLGIRLVTPPDRPPDPFSDEYREWTWDLYRQISGRPSYSTDNEASPFDLDQAVTRPYPFATGSATVVGEDLMARGHAITSLGIPAPARIVEFGPGWGNLTNDLVAMGHQVTAVEVDEQFCQLIRARCSMPEQLTTVCEDMLTFATDEPFDAAIFFESFHHCADHMAMLERLHHLVRPGGAIAFVGEPVDDLDYPWGPRLDGLSLWSTRTYGWLELGFDGIYFTRALARTGWRVTHHRGARPSGHVYIARPD